MSEIHFSECDITEAEIRLVADAMRCDRLSMGPRRDLFEQMVADRANRSQAVAVGSGTAALQLALHGLGVGGGDDVIASPFSSVATANAIVSIGARPVFVDIDPNSLNLDPARVEAAFTARTKAIIAVEVFGNTKHIDRIEQISQNHEIPLIEDASAAIGGRCNGRAAGSFGRASVFSFNTHLPVTTGEGGAIVTDDDRLAATCRSLRNQGQPEQPTDEADTSSEPGLWLTHERFGYSCRLSELACALGVAQLERLDQILAQRREVAGRYMRRLLDWDDLVLPNVPPGSEEHMAWSSFVVRLNNLYGQIERDRIIAGLRRHEVGASNHYPCIHLLPYYRQQYQHKRGDFPIAESIADRTIALPFYNRLDDTQVELICHTLKVMLQREQLLKRR